MTVERVVSIPSGVSVTMDGTVLHVKGPKGNLQRDMWYPGIEITSSEDVRLTELKSAVTLVGTLKSLLKHVYGVTKGYSIGRNVRQSLSQSSRGWRDP